MRFLWWLSGKESKTTESDEDSYYSSSEEESCASPSIIESDDESSSSGSISPVNFGISYKIENDSFSPKTLKKLSNLDNVSDTDSDSESSSTNFDIFYRKYGNVGLDREEVRLIYDAMDKLDYRDQFPFHLIHSFLKTYIGPLTLSLS